MLRLKWFAVIILAALISGAGAAAAESVQISINKASQKMTVTVDGVNKYVWLVSTGARSYSTPSGSYTPFRMEPDHYSDEWDDAPMPHSIFFTPAGHAIHGSPHTKSLQTSLAWLCQASPQQCRHALCTGAESRDEEHQGHRERWLRFRLGGADQEARMAQDVLVVIAPSRQPVGASWQSFLR
jgi:hypothetical protein